MKLNVTDWNIIPYADAWTRQTEWFDALIRAKQAGEEYEITSFCVNIRMSIL